MSRTISLRPIVQGKFLLLGDRKFPVHGVTYGPFRPNPDTGDHLASRERIDLDLAAMSHAGLNVIRVYYPPPLEFLDRAFRHGIRTLISIPDFKRNLFLDDRSTRRTVRRNVEATAARYVSHPGLLGYLVDNEMPPDLVRWYGPRRIEDFLNAQMGWIKNIDPHALVSYASYPPTEYICPADADFLGYNVFLHQRGDLEAYLYRLQNLAGDKPLILTECGMDTLRHPEEEQAALHQFHVEVVARTGLAGHVIFSWTDEWFARGVEMNDWAFGLVNRAREPKPAYRVIEQAGKLGDRPMMERFPLSSAPLVSIVVCAYNADATLADCLGALRRINYPNYEVIVVDDGSTDETAAIAAAFESVQLVRQPNRGLSVARNTGITTARGEIIAFTDADCMPDEDWLYFLVAGLQEPGCVATGGPNIPPPAKNLVQAAVAAAPGAPSHVLMDDRLAEHVPGCNFAAWKTALDDIGGFDAEFHQAGDDVDVCWRLIDRGGKILFCPGAVVWHYRRFTIGAYFQQQAGYGESEARLLYKHRPRFDHDGNPVWRGHVYGPPTRHSRFQRPVIYHGRFGAGWFQSIYTGHESPWTNRFAGIVWLAMTLLLFLASAVSDVPWILPNITAALTLGAALIQTLRARIERRRDGLCTRSILFFLGLTQPWIRGWARYFSDLQNEDLPSPVKPDPATPKPLFPGPLEFWSENGIDRLPLLERTHDLLRAEHWRHSLDTGWMSWDIHIFASRWWNLRIRTMTEVYPHNHCLTRVRIYPIPSNRAMLTAAFLAIGFILLLWFYHHLFISCSLVAAMLLLAPLVQLASLRRSITALIHRAAARAGFAANHPA